MRKRIASLTLPIAATLLLAGSAAAKEEQRPLLQPLVLGTSEPLSLDTWTRRSAELREEWMRVLGPFPERSPLNAQVLTTESLSDHTRYLVKYYTEPGSPVFAFLLVPKPIPSAGPAAVVFHATSSDHIFQSAGLATSATRHIGLHLVRKGYVVLCPRNFIYGYGNEELSTAPKTFGDYTSTSLKLLASHPQWTGMGKMLWDGMRAVDYLETRPEVDPKRLICIGHSLGAKETIYLTAFDTRIRAGVASEGGVGLALSNWDAPWYLGKQIKKKSFIRDHHELLAITAPRGILIAGGGQADGEHSRPWIEGAQPIFDLYAKPEALQLELHDQGHNFPDNTREKALLWLDKMLTD